MCEVVFRKPHKFGTYLTCAVPEGRLKIQYIDCRSAYYSIKQNVSLL